MSDPLVELHQPVLTPEDMKEVFGDDTMDARWNRYGRKCPAIGIDLGTHSCRVAICLNGKVEILADDQDSRTTPSWVSFTDAGRLIGAAAKNQAAFNVKNTVYGVKRLMGRKFNDAEVQRGIEHWPFNVVNFKEQPRVSVECGGETTLLPPEEITAVILAKMKETTEAVIGEKVKDAVITVPGHYNYLQREAIEKAGTIAGLNVLRMEIEQEAVIVAYLHYVRPLGNTNVLIFNLGAGTFEVSVVPITGGYIGDVKATSGGAHLGGEDFDNRLVAHCLQEFTRKHNKDISKNSNAIWRLKTACELAKKTLSSSTEASIEIPSLIEGIDFCINVSRDTFEDLCDDLFESTIASVESFLMATKLDKTKIDDVVLVGGSTRIPKVRKLLTDFFNGKAPNTSMDPDEAVVYGAAMLAESLESLDHIDEWMMACNATVSLGIEMASGAMSTVIHMDQRIPNVTSLTFSTHSDNQSGVIVRVFKGESSTAKDNDLIGEIGLTGISPAPRGVPRLQVTFDIRVEGVLYVTVQDMSTTKFNHIQIQAWDNNTYITSKAFFKSFAWHWERCRDTSQSQLASADYQLENYDYAPKPACDKLSASDTITSHSPWAVGMKWLKQLLHTYSPSLARMQGDDKSSHQSEPREGNVV